MIRKAGGGESGAVAPASPSSSAASPAERVAVESEEIPAIVQLRAV